LETVDPLTGLSRRSEAGWAGAPNIFISDKALPGIPWSLGIQEQVGGEWDLIRIEERFSRTKR